jgi:ankyrin repeat protein
MVLQIRKTTRVGHPSRLKHVKLERGDIDVYSKGSDGLTPLAFAEREGHQEIVKMLLERGGVAVESKESKD